MECVRVGCDSVAVLDRRGGGVRAGGLWGGVAGGGGGRFEWCRRGGRVLALRSGTARRPVGSHNGHLSLSLQHQPCRPGPSQA